MRRLILLAFFCLPAGACPEGNGMEGRKLFYVSPEIHGRVHLAQDRFRRAFSGPPLFSIRVRSGKAKWGNGINDLVFVDQYDTTGLTVKEKGWHGFAVGDETEADIAISRDLLESISHLVIVHEILHTLGLGHAPEGIMVPAFEYPAYVPLISYPLIKGLSEAEIGFLSCHYGVVWSGEAMVALTQNLFNRRRLRL